MPDVLAPQNDNDDEGVVASVDHILLCNRQGVRTGIIDVCRTGAGSVTIRVNRIGVGEVVFTLPPAIADRLADILHKAVCEIGGG